MQKKPCSRGPLPCSAASPCYLGRLYRKELGSRPSREQRPQGVCAGEKQDHAHDPHGPDFLCGERALVIVVAVLQRDLLRPHKHPETEKHRNGSPTDENESIHTRLRRPIFSASKFRYQRRHEPPSAGCRSYAAPDSSEDPLHTSTILPVTPPLPSSSCACLASTRGRRCAMSGLIFCCLRRSNRAIKSCRNHAGLSRLSHWML